jgi:hypothetical protein
MLRGQIVCERSRHANPNTRSLSNSDERGRDPFHAMHKSVKTSTKWETKAAGPPLPISSQAPKHQPTLINSIKNSDFYLSIALPNIHPIAAFPTNNPKETRRWTNRTATLTSASRKPT